MKCRRPAVAQQIQQHDLPLVVNQPSQNALIDRTPSNTSTASTRGPRLHDSAMARLIAAVAYTVTACSVATVVADSSKVHE